MSKGYFVVCSPLQLYFYGHFCPKVLNFVAHLDLKKNRLVCNSFKNFSILNNYIYIILLSKKFKLFYNQTFL